MNTNCIPIINTVSGSTLTNFDWQITGISYIACEFEALLYKPGSEFFNTSCLQEYFGKEHKIILDASKLCDKNGVYNFKSPYDGTKLTYTTKQLVDLIIKINPVQLILPETVTIGSDWLNMPSNILMFLPQSLSANAYTYTTKAQITLKNKADTSDFYLTGRFLELSINNKIFGMISDIPANAGANGYFYVSSGKINLLSSKYQNDFSLLSESCECSTCQQKLTKAYLYHLFDKVPLLCKRFLIIHNAFYFNNFV